MAAFSSSEGSPLAMEFGSSQLSSKQKLAFAAIVALFALLPFLQCIDFQFLLNWDDGVLFSHEGFLHFNSTSILYWLSGGCYGQIFLIPFLTFMLDYSIAGLNPAFFHAHSLLWHVIACVGVFYCFTLFRVRLWLALLFSIVYAVHPQKAESVAWVLERRDMIFGAFTAWSFYFYVKAGAERRFLPLPLLLFALSLLSKPTAVAFPAILVAFEFSRVRWDSLKSTAFRVAPFILLSLCLIAFTSLAVKLDEVHQQKSLLQQFANVIHNYPWYFTSFLAPWDLLPIYPYVPISLGELAPSICLWLGLFALLAFLYIRAREFLFRGFVPVWLAFGAALTPTIGFIKYSGFDYADRYNYMPSAFLCFAGAWLFSRLLDWVEAAPEERRAGLVAPALKVCLCLWVAAIGLSAALYAQAFSSCLNLFTAASLPDKPNIMAPGLLAFERFSLGIPAADELYVKLESCGFIDKLKQSKTAFYSDSLDTCVFLKAAETMRANPAAIKDKLPLLLELSKGRIGKASSLSRFLILKTILEFQLKAGMHDDAILTLDQLAAHMDDPFSLQASTADKLFFQGLAAFLRKDYDKSAEFFLASLKIHPGSLETKANLERAIAMRDAARGKASAPAGTEAVPPSAK